MTNQKSEIRNQKREVKAGRVAYKGVALHKLVMAHFGGF
jgi:hypothetical protein